MRTNLNEILSRFVLIFAFLFLIVTPVALSEELTAYEVMKKVDERYDGDTAISNITMILMDRKGNKRARQIKAFSKDYGKDSKSISFFISPADVRNTSFLTYDWDDETKDDDNWLYLPALRKVKRIASGNKKDSFMGSDFSYADMNGLKLDEWIYRFKSKHESVDGKDCWVIEAKPKKKIRRRVIKDTGYVKTVSWIRKDILIPVKSKLYVKKGKKIKYFSALEIEQVQGIWTVKKSTMVTTKKNKKEHATVMILNNIVYNEVIEDTLFNTQRMERGL